MTPSRHGDLLVIALGGGGDTIAAAMLAADLEQDNALHPVLVSPVWEKRVKDPQPGPRRVTELRDIERWSVVLGKVGPSSRLPNGELLTHAVVADALRLSDCFAVGLDQGVLGVVGALQFLAERYAFRHIWAVDVGGDVLARESYPTLRTPLADAMMLAATVAVFPESNVVVFGPGLDTEIPPDRYEADFARDRAKGQVLDVRTLSPAVVAAVERLLDRRVVETDATAMMVRAHNGLRGSVLLRDDGPPAAVNERSTQGFVYRGEYLGCHVNALAPALVRSATLAEAHNTCERLGFPSELTYELRASAATPGSDRAVHGSDILDLARQIAIEQPDVDYISERHIARRLSASPMSVHRAVDQLWPTPVHRPPFVPLRRGAEVISRREFSQCDCTSAINPQDAKTNAR